MDYEAYDDPATVEAITNFISERDWASYHEVKYGLALDDEWAVGRAMMQMITYGNLASAGVDNESYPLWEVR